MSTFTIEQINQKFDEILEEYGEASFAPHFENYLNSIGVTYEDWVNGLGSGRLTSA